MKKLLRKSRTRRNSWSSRWRSWRFSTSYTQIKTSLVHKESALSWRHHRITRRMDSRSKKIARSPTSRSPASLTLILRVVLVRSNPLYSIIRSLTHIYRSQLRIHITLSREQFRQICNKSLAIVPSYSHSVPSNFTSSWCLSLVPLMSIALSSSLDNTSSSRVAKKLAARKKA